MGQPQRIQGLDSYQPQYFKGWQYLVRVNLYGDHVIHVIKNFMNHIRASTTPIQSTADGAEANTSGRLNVSRMMIPCMDLQQVNSPLNRKLSRV